MHMRADDGEVEALGFENVAGDSLHVGRGYFVDATQDIFQRADFAEGEECGGGVACDLVASFQ